MNSSAEVVADTNRFERLARPPRAAIAEASPVWNTQPAIFGFSGAPTSRAGRAADAVRACEESNALYEAAGVAVVRGSLLATLGQAQSASARPTRRALHCKALSPPR